MLMPLISIWMFGHQLIAHVKKHGSQMVKMYGWHRVYTRQTML